MLQHTNSWNYVRALASVCLGTVALVATANVAFAKKGFSELYPFCQQQNCTDGENPQSNLLVDNSGNLYGTTPGGGAYGQGTVFKVTPGGKESVLYSFCAQQNCTDGSQPLSSLIRDAQGNLYGTTYYGGAAGGGGTVFKLAPDGTETVLYSFCPEQCQYGENPDSAVVMDGSGNLYGTTRYGGLGYGAVFELSPDGTETVLYEFGNSPDGALPFGNLLLYGGALYGTTPLGGADSHGTIFRLSKKGSETVLYSFTGGSDGSQPLAGLVADKSGNFYGTTEYGGTSGLGVVFELSTGGTESALYSFTGGSDGQWPLGPVLVKSTRKGIALYGTTNAAGANAGHGTAFKITGGKATILHTFGYDSCADPGSGLIRYKGWFYGTSVGAYSPNDGCVFKLGTGGD